MEPKTDEKDGKFCKKCKIYFVEYCKNTSIHGVRYFGERRRSVCEKIWWFIIMAISCTYCVTRIIDTYEKWESSPVVVTFATAEKPIWEIPFPAVTICPQVKADPKKFNYTEILHKKEDNITLTQEEEINFDYMSLICGYRDYLNYSLDFIVNDAVYDFYDMVTSPFNNYDHVVFMNKRLSFNRSFMPIFTDDGVCHTFNMLDRDEIYTDIVKHFQDYHKSKYQRKGWSLEGGFDRNADKNAYPKRTVFAGALSSLYIELYISSTEVDYSCTGGIQGFKVQVHHPAELPLLREQYFLVPLDQSVMAAVEPKMMITSDDVRLYSPQKRGCYLPSERKLRYFKHYTQNNCEIECKTNITLEECDCVNYYMPRDNSTPVCGGSNLDCMTDAEDDYLTNFVTFDISKKKKKGVDFEKLIRNCDCLPDCTSIAYSVEISQTNYDWEDEYKAERYVENDKTLTKQNYRISSLKIFYKTNQFIPSERRELIGFTDLLANFGGLLGLFTGFSVLSLQEIIYFLTLRLWCNVRIYGKNFWYGTNES